jgi:hypothetical protein
MATREALAIREEKAQARIVAAAEKLAAQTGNVIPEIKPTTRDPFAKSAELYEQVADLMESMIVLDVEEVDNDDDDNKPDGDVDQTQDQETTGGGDNQEAGGGSTPRRTRQPIKRSKAKSRRG